MKRIIAMILICCFVLLTLVACGKKGKGDDTGSGDGSGSESTDSQSVNTATLSDTDEYGQNLLNSAINIDELDYEGEEINILIVDDVALYREWAKKDTDAADADARLDEQVAKRNEIVATDLNITPNMFYESRPTFTHFNTLIYTDVDQGVHQYDICANFAYFASDVMVRDALANINDKSTFKHFNFELPCWNQAIVNNTTINDKLFLVAGDLNLSLFDLTTVIWVNKELYGSMKEADDPADIQQHAIDGKWVYDDLYKWAQRSADKSGADAECSNTYGFSAEHLFIDAIPHAWDLQFVKADDQTGKHSFTIEGNTKAQDALDKLNDIFDSPGYAMQHNNHFRDTNICQCGTGHVGHFAAGDRVFIAANLYGDEAQNQAIRGMTQKYALLPIPKYEATQPNYGTTSADHYNLVCVLDHADKNGEAISAYLQYMNEKSYTDVREFYFTRIVRSKYFGLSEDKDGTTQKSITIFNTILNNIEFNMETIYSCSIGDIGWLWRDNIILGNGASLETSFLENSLSNGGVYRTKEIYEQYLAEFDAWIFDEQ